MDSQEIREPVVIGNQGQKLFGVFHLPIGKAAVPVVLICHGLAGQKTGKFRAYVDLAERLAAAKIAVLRFDYRGCGDSEGTFAEITPEDHVSDTLAALDFLATNERVDMTRLGIMGRSFGGVVAIRAAAQHGKVKSLALWCPMFSGEQWLEQWQLLQSGLLPADSAQQMMQVNGQQGSLAFFDQFLHTNIGNDLRKLTRTPLLHIHGECDEQISIDHADWYAQCRCDGEGKSKFIRLSNCGHDFDDIEEREQALKETCAWFTETLNS